MKSIVEQKLLSFKSLEQKIFAYVCELGSEITRIMLESCDAELAEEGAKSQYWNKGKRTTTIKTVYGEVVYALDCFSVPSNFWNGWCCMR